MERCLQTILPAYQIELVREQVGDNQALDAALAQLLNIGLFRKEEIPGVKRTILLHKVYESVPIKLQLNDEEMALFAVHRWQFSGVDIRTRLARHYPLREIAVHAIGYVSAINEEDMKQIDSAEYAGTSLIGKVGVEGAYEQLLHGKPGFKEILVNARRQAGRQTRRLRAATRFPRPRGRHGFDLGVGRARAKGRGGGIGRQTRIGSCARSTHRRHHRTREHSGIRSQRLRSRSFGCTVRCSSK